jgi:ubiquinone biosynthesis protein COQ4
MDPMYELLVATQTLAGRLRPCDAMRALAAFFSNPDDVSQVFRVVRALDGQTAEAAFRRFCATPTGRALLAREATLAQSLVDREALRRMPPDSLGRAYLAFVECERIAVEGLIDAAARSGIHARTLDPARITYRSRLHAMHDLLHVVTGYGTDELGEACLLAFTYAQNRTRGLLPVVYALGARIWLHFPGVRITGPIREGFELGKRAAWFAVQDWENLLARPLAEVRDSLMVGAPQRYLVEAPLAERLDARRNRRLES